MNCYLFLTRRYGYPLSLIGHLNDYKGAVGCKSLFDRLFLHINDTGGDKNSTFFYMNRDFLLEHNNNISQNIGNRHIVVLITCGVLYLFIIDDKEVQDAAGYEYYDVAVANILADVIIMLQKEIPVHIKKGGIFITSGIINMKEEAVKEAFAANSAFVIIEVTYQG